MDIRKRQIEGQWGKRGEEGGEEGGKRGERLSYKKDGGARRKFREKLLTGQICLEMQVNEEHTLLLYDKHHKVSSFLKTPKHTQFCQI